MKELIAVVEDEEDILELVSLHLKRAMFEIAKFQDADTFLTSLETQTPKLIILDLMLPDMDGMEICSHLKSSQAYSNIPIIMLTAKGEEASKILGLESGADDYITKPFSPKELVARVKAVLRRTSPALENTFLRFGDVLKVDTQQFKVFVENEEVLTTTTEFKILTLLLKKPGNVFTREQILDHLWGEDKSVIDRTVDVHVKNLRKKIGVAGIFIKNIRSVGYKLEL